MAEAWQSGGFGLYVHWPFCEAKCPYCDFNSHVVKGVDHTRWATAMVRELRRYSALTPHRVLNSIYFGGGTPSLMDPSTVGEILKATRDDWLWANDIEVTLEANPRSVEMAKFERFAEAGINRVSIGLQSLRDDDLKRLGRLHSACDGRKAVEIAKSIFDRVSIDLIYARQNQTLDDWLPELEEALGIADDHLSLYQLTIEDGTAFGARAAAGNLRGLPDEDRAVDLYEATSELCARHGFSAYEVSNYAKRGAESRHNLIYWSGGDYVGIGPGAHGRVTVQGVRKATSAWKPPGKWLERAEQGNADEESTVLDTTEILVERIMMGLRLKDGIDLSNVPDSHRVRSDKIDELAELGLIQHSDQHIAATRKGRLVLNAVIEAILPD